MRREHLRLTLLALGSRGDVQPLVALGEALQERGHQVCVATEQDYMGLAEQRGLASSCVGGSIREQMDFDMVYQALDAADRALPLGFALSFLKQVGPLVQRIVADTYTACQGADGVIASTLGCYPGLSVAEKLNIPMLSVHFHPRSSTRDMPDLSFPNLPTWLPGRAYYHQLTHVLAAQGLWQLLRPSLNQARRELLGLAALTPRVLWQRTNQESGQTLYAYSPHIAPPPADWTVREAVTGYWFLKDQANWQPPDELQAFLDNGPPPIYVGFGSLLAGREPDEVTRIVIAALERSGQRGLLYAGWGDFARTPLPSSCLRIESVPHTWLFPRTAAVVTHCGAGTVAAALLAGTPVIGVPFFGDQIFWGQRVQALGAGTAPIPRRHLSTDNLAEAIQQTTQNPSLRQNARALSQVLSCEDGIRKGVKLAEDFFQPR